MEIGKQPTEQLLEFCFKTLNKALFEMSQNKAESDRKVLANILMNDLNEKFFRLDHQEVTQAFHRGVREGEEFSINPRTWFKWLNKQKLKANKLRIENSQEGERLQIESKCQQIDKEEVLREWLEVCLVELYELHIENEKYSFVGITRVFKWLEKNNLIHVSDQDKVKLFNEVQEEIIGRKKFVHNKKKIFDPRIMCREKAIKKQFGKWKIAKFDLRKEIYKIIGHEPKD